MSVEKYDSTTGIIKTTIMIMEKVFTMMLFVLTDPLNINKITNSTITKNK